MPTMQTPHPSAHRIHPLLAVAAVSVTLVSLVGIAAMTDMLPKSQSATDTGAHQAAMLATAPAPLLAPPGNRAIDAVHNKPAVHHTALATVKPAQQSVPVAQRSAPAPVAQNSPLGIGVGAVVGGLLGNQVGGGNGKTLATIAGAVGGGYLGNEIAKKNQ